MLPKKSIKSQILHRIKQPNTVRLTDRQTDRQTELVELRLCISSCLIIMALRKQLCFLNIPMHSIFQYRNIFEACLKRYQPIFVDNRTSKESQLLFNYAQEFFYMQEPKEFNTETSTVKLGYSSHRDQRIYFYISLICYILKFTFSVCCDNTTYRFGTIQSYNFK